MNYFPGFLGLFCFLIVNITADNTSLHLENLLSEIRTALNVEIPESGQTRQQQYPYRPQNNWISLNVYEALRSIAKNDELECISRLLCEAAAGGRPGFSGKQIKFDKLSLTKLMSYLKLDIGSSSPLLTFGKAALLGVSNRGDSYSCIINYPKCPKDQSRLLYYLNNHRGGFFQYFDKQHHKPGNYYYQNPYRPGYQKYHTKFKRNKIQFESPGGLYEKLKKKATSDVYATRYTHSTLTFPDESLNPNKPMVFPKSDGSVVNPRILTKPVRLSPEKNDFFISNSNRYPKKLKEFTFFPEKENSQFPAAVAIDRLPSRLYFPESINYLTRYSPNSFFPNT